MSDDLEDFLDGLDSQDTSKEDPILSLSVLCPVCGNPDKIPYWQLKEKSVAVAFDRFYVPRFTGTSKFRTIDYNLINLAVCPKCHFASADKRDFIGKSPVTGKPEKSQLKQELLDRLKATAGDRKVLWINHKGSPKLFDRDRDASQAALANRFLVQRLGIEIELKLPFATYRRGYAQVRLARLEKEAGLPCEATQRLALADLNEAFIKTDFPNDEIQYQAIYTIGALTTRLGDEKEAVKWISLLDKCRQDMENLAKKSAGVNVGPARKWVAIAREMWERRAEPGFWDA